MNRVEFRAERSTPGRDGDFGSPVLVPYIDGVSLIERTTWADITSDPRDLTPRALGPFEFDRHQYEEAVQATETFGQETTDWSSFAKILRQRIGTSTRQLIGIAGPPGVGKSTVAAGLAVALNDLGVTTAVLPMDGFHFSQAELRARGIRDRMGAPDTFDVEGFIGILESLRDETAVVAAPAFDRSIEEPVPDAILIDPSIRIVLVEGNYLLHDADGWQPVAGLLDHVWYLEADDERRISRLIHRHIESGKSQLEAESWVRDVDEPNARLIKAGQHRGQTLLLD